MDGIMDNILSGDLDRSRNKMHLRVKPCHVRTHVVNVCTVAPSHVVDLHMSREPRGFTCDVSCEITCTHHPERHTSLDRSCTSHR